MAFRPEVQELAAKLNVDPLPELRMPPEKWQRRVSASNRWRDKLKVRGVKLTNLHLDPLASAVIDHYLPHYPSKKALINAAIERLEPLEPKAREAMDYLMRCWGFESEAEATSAALQWLAKYTLVHDLQTLDLSHVSSSTHVKE